MSISSATARTGPYAASGSVTDFPFDFHAASADEVQVELDGEIVSDLLYTVDMDDDQSTNPGGTVIFSAAPVGDVLWIVSDPLFTQEADFANAGAFLLETVTDALDRGALRDLKLKDDLSRTVKAPLGATPIDYELLISGMKGDPGGNVMAIGLFAALAAISVPAGTTVIHTSGHTDEGKGGALYVEDTTLDDADVAAHPEFYRKTLNNRYFKLHHEQLLNLFKFGAAGAPTYTGDAAALVAMDAYFATAATNPSAGGYYTGSWTLDSDGDFYFGATTIQPRYSLTIRGSGASHFIGGGASARWRWADGVHGIIPQGPNTSGTDAYDLGTTLQGCINFKAYGTRFEGGYSGDQAKEGLWHGIVPRCPFWFEDCDFVNWSGYGLRGWAGNVIGVGTLGGNVSESGIVRCKFENNYVGRSIRGSDGNIIRGIGNAYYQNRLRGFEDDNGAGSTIEIDPHFAYNGRINNPNYWTQTHLGGYRYGLRVGGNKNNAPSGGPTHTADWIFIEAGGAIANDIPDYNAALDFRAGGDAITLNNAGVQFLAFYSEYGGLSQLNLSTEVRGGTLAPQYVFGGHFFGTLDADGYVYRTTNSNPFFVIDNRTIGATEGGISIRKDGVQHALVDGISGAFLLYRTTYSGGHIFQIGTTIIGTNDADGYKVPSGAGYWVNGVRVLQARQTGWAADTGTAKRTANATYAAGAALTFSAAYTKAELDAVGTRLAAIEAALQDATRTQKAIKDDLITHGVIGA